MSSLLATVGVVLLFLSAIFFFLSVVTVIVAMRRRREAVPSAAVVAPSPKATIAVPAAQLPSPFGTLTCTHGPLKGEAFVLRSAGLTIGREAPADIVIADPSVSKRHVWIGPREQQIVAIDGGSTNGTYINSLSAERISEAVLKSGDVIIVGTNDFARFEFRGAM